MIDPRTSEYESRHQCLLIGPLGPGPGQDGFVLRSDRLTAVKFFDNPNRFRRELEVYRLLDAKGIYEIAGHNIPALIGWNEEVSAIEMTIVERPFLLDFAGAKRPEEVPDFELHGVEEHIERMRELFGNRWADALHVAEMFRQQTSFTLMDIHPGNIAFDDEN